MKITDKGIAVIANDTHISHWVESEGTLMHNKWLNEILQNHIVEGNTVIDIGANIGTMTAFFSLVVGYTGSVYCFEPNPEAFECLAYNFRGMKNVIMLQQALGDKAGRGAMALNVNAGASHLKEGDEFSITTLDSFTFDRLDFIKIDAEGFEPRILKGAEKTIARHRPKMLIEVVDSHLKRFGSSRAELFELITTFGYSFANVNPLDETIDGEQFDILCTPND